MFKLLPVKVQGTYSGTLASDLLIYDLPNIETSLYGHFWPGQTLGQLFSLLIKAT